MVENNPRYKNVLFLTLHYIDSPNFMCVNILEDTYLVNPSLSDRHVTLQSSFQPNSNLYPGRREILKT